MKYLTAWTIRPENMKAVIKRFLDENPQTPGGEVSLPNARDGYRNGIHPLGDR